MSKIVKNLEKVFAATAFAEEGEIDTAVHIMQENIKESHTEAPRTRKEVRVSLTPVESESCASTT